MISTEKDSLPVSGGAEETQNGFSREREGGHDPKEDVDSVIRICHSKLNILVYILRLNVFSYLQMESKFIVISRFLWEYQVFPTTSHTKAAITIYGNKLG